MQAVLQNGLAGYAQSRAPQERESPPLHIDYLPPAGQSAAAKRFGALYDAKPKAPALEGPPATGPPPTLALEDGAPPAAAAPSTAIGLPLLGTESEESPAEKQEEATKEARISPAVAKLALKIQSARQGIQALGHITKVAVTTASLNMRVHT